MLKRLYEWTMSLAARPRAKLWLAIVAFVESSFFLIPADVLFVPIALGYVMSMKEHAESLGEISASNGVHFSSVAFWPLSNRALSSCVSGAACRISSRLLPCLRCGSVQCCLVCLCSCPRCAALCALFARTRPRNPYWFGLISHCCTSTSCALRARLPPFFSCSESANWLFSRVPTRAFVLVRGAQRGRTCGSCWRGTASRRGGSRSWTCCTSGCRRACRCCCPRPRSCPFVSSRTPHGRLV